MTIEDPCLWCCIVLTVIASVVIVAWPSRRD